MILRQLRRAGSAWKRYLNYPLFVPAEGRITLEVLDARGPNAFIEEIQRFSALGSPWAAAILGYLHLRGAISGERNVQAAIESCMNHASNGHTYAQYILSWALLLAGRERDALETMKRCGVKLFPPATLDLPRFVWHGYGVAHADRRVALELLSHASAVGHASAFLFRCAFLRSGEFGVVRQLIGLMLTPVALIRYAIALRWDPFASQVFFFDPNARRPLFRSIPGAATSDN